MLKADLWFPSIVWTEDDTGADSDWLKRYADQLRAAKPEGVKVSNAGGWQSQSIEYYDFEQDSLYPPELHTFKSKLDDVISNVTKQANLPPCTFANMWFNINGHKDHNMMHDHQNSLLSGVFYSHVPEPNEMGNIEFHREDSAVHFLPMLDRYNHFTSHKASYQPRKGLMLVFPSWLKHSVNSNMSQLERYSLSFNYVPKPQR